MQAEVTAFFDEPTNTVSYVVADAESGACAIIDPVLDFDLASGRTSRQSADRIIGFVREHDLDADWVLETHVHADHLSSAAYLRQQLACRTAIGKGVTSVQQTFGDLFNAGDDFARDGSQFDRLLGDGDTITVGKLGIRAIATPGHTPACMTYVAGDAAFVGDTLFMPDFGTARTDFPGGDAATLYRSIQKIFALPPETRLYMCHDYKAPGRDEFRWESTVQEESQHNIHVGGGKTEADFVEFRTARDATLSVPRLLLPSVQVNIRAGEFPPAENNGKRYLKLPIDAL